MVHDNGFERNGSSVNLKMRVININTYLSTFIICKKK